MTDGIDKLVILQRLDLRIGFLRGLIDRAPAEREALAAELAAAKAELEAKQAELEEGKKRLRRKESELAAGEDRLRQVQAKLNQVKTNKEYDAALKEIDEQKQVIGMIESAILEIYDEVEASEAKRAELEDGWAERTAEFEQRAAEFESRVKAAGIELEKRQAARGQVAPAIDPEVMKRYQALVEKTGQALVRADKETCTGCHQRIPAQIYNEALKGLKLVNCSNCLRILVHPESRLELGEDD